MNTWPGVSRHDLVIGRVVPDVGIVKISGKCAIRSGETVSPVEIVRSARYGTPLDDYTRVSKSDAQTTFNPFIKLESGFCPMAEVTGPDFSKSELLPAIAQDSATGEVLMMAWMNREAYEETLRTGRVCYFSRSRQKLWRKGEESGNVQELRAIYFDCDGDTLLVKVRQIGGAACHEGYSSCFFRRIDPATQSFTVEGERVFDPKSVYGK